jgi:hypothetical protein
MKARSRRYRVVIARTLSTKPLPKIPGRQWQPNRFANGRDAWGVIARDHAEAELIVGLCPEFANRVVWIVSSTRAHQGPATIHAAARMATARMERTDRSSNLRMLQHTRDSLFPALRY